CTPCSAALGYSSRTGTRRDAPRARWHHECGGPVPQRPRAAGRGARRFDGEPRPRSFGVRYGTTVTGIGSSAAPGAGKPITGTNGDDDVGDGTQKVAAKTAMPPLTAGVPCRTIAPSFRVGKHAVVGASEQQSCEMPPVASMQRPSPSLATQAEPAHSALQVPAPQLSS